MKIIIALSAYLLTRLPELSISLGSGNLQTLAHK